MRLRSSDRQQKERPPAGQRTSCDQDLSFHATVILISMVLYFSGVEYAMTWIEWWQAQTLSHQNNSTPSPNNLHQQQLLHLLAVQKTIRKHQIQTLQATIQHHPIAQQRAEAQRILDTLAPPVSGVPTDQQLLSQNVKD